MAEKVYPRISTAVSKLGPCIACVNLPPVATCREDGPCFKDCYARRGRFRFNNVADAIKKNLEAYQQNPVGYFNVISASLDMIPYKYFRYHSSGDIPDEQYLDLMCKTARKHRNTKFLCFTKKFEIVNNYLDKHPKPKNLTLVFSNWGDWQCENPHNLPTAWVKFTSETEVPENAKKCSGFCGGCVKTEGSCWSLKKGQAVYFKKH